MIRAEVTVDNDTNGPVVEFDATPWFEQASDRGIEWLRDEEYCAGEASDEVAEFCADKDATVEKFFEYVRFGQQFSRGSGFGFSCRISVKEAEAWITDNRPSLQADGK